MNKEISNIVVIDRDDYDELVEKANRTDAEINERAEHKFMRNNEVPVRIEFNQYRNGNNFSAPIGFIRHSDSNQLWEALDKIEPKVEEWMNENFRIFDKKLKERYITEKNVNGLSKRVINLEQRLRELKIKYTFALSYAVIVTSVMFFLLWYLK